MPASFGSLSTAVVSKVRPGSMVGSVLFTWASLIR
jgi:hypothetical protein